MQLAALQVDVRSAPRLKCSTDDFPTAFCRDMVAPTQTDPQTSPSGDDAALAVESFPAPVGTAVKPVSDTLAARSASDMAVATQPDPQTSPVRDDVAVVADGYPSPAKTTPGTAGTPESYGEYGMDLLQALQASAREKCQYVQRSGTGPLCGVDEETGILVLRACLAEAARLETWCGSEKHTSAPLWGGDGDWMRLRPNLLKCLHPDSVQPPDNFLTLPAAFWRDAEFVCPKTEDNVLVHGGTFNVTQEGMAGCHFMPFLTKEEYGRLLPPSCPSRFCDMVISVASRSGSATLADQVRESGDCYFHSILCILHFRGVLLSKDIFRNAENPLGMYASKFLVPHVVLDQEMAERHLQDMCLDVSQGAPQGTPGQGIASEEAGRSGASLQSQPEPVQPCKRKLRFENALDEQSAAGRDRPDPVTDMLRHVQEQGADFSLDEFYFQDCVFDGYLDKDEVYKTVKECLLHCYNGTETHRQLATNLDFDLRFMVPAPLAAAVNTVAKRRGLSPEALLAVLDANVGFMEDPTTTLTHQLDSMHEITPASPVIVGSASSTRKSHLIKASDDWMLTSREAPDIFKDRTILNTDSTTKGIRNCLEAHSRCAVSSDEAATTFDTKFSDKESGLHFLAPTKLNTWTQGEYDGPQTGQSKQVLGAYNFMLKVAGQTEVCECILNPKVHGFQKRIKQVWSLATLHTDDNQCSKDSDNLIQEYHDWMLRTFTAPGKGQKLSLDGFALSVYRSAKEALMDAMKEMPKMPPAWQSKLQFFHSDVLRETHKVMRACQFLNGKFGKPDADRVTAAVDEISVGLMRWLRQVQLHFGFYRWAQRNQKKEHSRNEVHEAVLAEPQYEEEEEQTPEDEFMKLLLEKAPKDQMFTAKQVRDWFRNKRSDWYRKGLADKILTAIDHLLTRNLLQYPDGHAAEPETQHVHAPEDVQPEDEKVAPVAKKAASKKAARRAKKTARGRPTVQVKKRTLADIMQDEAADQERKRLKVNSSEFS
ncbi:unnamed protein product [Symbiodinium necroappetens]|uniref:Homeobox domain-containing protein n=1 Tax=Symbiodinium necroappetens TaxID=1628268 RepID=A0A813BT52_9DINO|nr:unnamed protein product [Symbiodinium necroappetens]